MFKVWLEWDLGQDNLVFTTAYKARDWLDAAIKGDESLVEEFPNGFNDVDEAGLCGIIELFVDPIYLN
jgi:hypothetical protein